MIAAVALPGLMVVMFGSIPVAVTVRPVQATHRRARPLETISVAAARVLCQVSGAPLSMAVVNGRCQWLVGSVVNGLRQVSGAPLSMAASVLPLLASRLSACLPWHNPRVMRCLWEAGADRCTRACA